MAGSAFGGGVVRHGETCGALIGLIMAIGMVAGRKKIENVSEKEPCMKLASEARDAFLERVGHTLCAEIQRILFGRSYRMYLDEERQMFHDAGGHSREGCPGVCGKAARIAAEIILREREGKVQGE